MGMGTGTWKSMLCLLEDPPKVLSLKVLDIVAVAVAVVSVWCGLTLRVFLCE